MIEDIGTYVTGATGVGTLGTNVFLHVMPETTAGVMAIVEEAGGAPAYTIGGTVPAYVDGQVTVLVRSTAGPNGQASPVNARNRIQRAWNRLNGVSNATLSGSTYLRIEPINNPHLMDRDAQGRYVFACSFSVWRRGTTGV